MKRSHVASDVLDQLRACMNAELGDRCLEYQWGRTRGIPPADCNSISASWVDRAQTQPFGDCDTDACDKSWDATIGLRIALTRVCMGPDQQPTFDWKLEDAAAACFDDDLDILENCVNCIDWSQLKADHFLDVFRYDGTTHDVEANGGGYSAYIEITVVARECCVAAG